MTKRFLLAFCILSIFLLASCATVRYFAVAGGYGFVVKRSRMNRMCIACLGHALNYAKHGRTRRAAEMCSARLDHREDLGDMIRLRVTGKRNKDRKVDIQTALFQAIRATFPSETFLFQT